MTNLIKVSKVAFSIGEYDIYWYGIIIASAILLDFVLVFFLAKYKKLDKEAPFDLVLFLVPLGIIFGRLFAVIFDSDLSISEYFDFRGGGMSIIGAVFGGAIGVFLYSLIKKQNMLRVADIVAPLVILAQSIGRWGNFFNQEIYGREILDPSKQWFPNAVFIDAEGGYFQALFFYESMLNLLGFAVLITLFFTVKKDGIVLSAYLIFYGASRLVLESFRQEQYVLRLLGMPISQVLSGVMVVIGIVLMVVIISKKQKFNVAVEGRKNEKK